MLESVISKQIRVAIARTRRALVMRNYVGKVVPWGRKDAYPVDAGLGEGSPDLVGVLIPSGRAFCLEVKTITGRVSKEQTQCHAAWRRRGVFVAVVRSVDEALAALDRAERGGSE